MKKIILTIALFITFKTALAFRQPEIKETRETQDVYWSIMSFNMAPEAKLQYLTESDKSDSEWDPKLTFDNQLKCKFKQSIKKNIFYSSAYINCESPGSKLRIGPVRCDLNPKDRKFSDEDFVNFDYKTKEIDLRFKINCHSVPKEKFRACPLDFKKIEGLSFDGLNDVASETFKKYCEQVVYEKLIKVKKPTARTVYLESFFMKPSCYMESCNDEAWERVYGKWEKSCELGFQDACYFYHFTKKPDPTDYPKISKKFCDIGVMVACAQLAGHLYVEKNPEWKLLAQSSCKNGSEMGCALLETHNIVNPVQEDVIKTDSKPKP